VYSDVPAIFDGSTAAVIFVGTSTKVTDVHGIKKDNQFAKALEDNTIQQGAPNHHLSNKGQALISNKVEDILCTFCLDSWQSEPHQHHQNPANSTNRIFDRTGAPAHVWLLCLQHVCYPLNHTYNSTINNAPLT
jgi:hypothetical protein